MKSKKALEHGKEPAQLPENLSKRLAGYALAATATAGLGLMGVVAPAEGAIITHSSPLTIPCDLSTEVTQLNIVGAVDLSFAAGCQTGGPSNSTRHFVQDLIDAGAKGASIAMADSFRGHLAAARFGKGGTIGPADVFGQSLSGGHVAGGLVAVFSAPAGQQGGNWLFQKGYLGFELSSHGRHFGWVAMSIYGLPFTAQITEYAYDTVPGQTIDAGQTSAVPEPGTLSLLALGVIGLTAIRKKRLSGGGR